MQTKKAKPSPKRKIWPSVFLISTLYVVLFVEYTQPWGRCQEKICEFAVLQKRITKLIIDSSVYGMLLFNLITY